MGNIFSGIKRDSNIHEKMEIDSTAEEARNGERGTDEMNTTERTESETDSETSRENDADRDNTGMKHNVVDEIGTEETKIPAHEIMAKCAFDYARDGKEDDLKSLLNTLDDFEILNWPNPHLFNRTLLQMASIHGQVEIVRYLMNIKGIDVNKAIKVDENKMKSNIPLSVLQMSGSSPLACACYQGHCEVVKALLEDPGVQVHQLNANNDTPLHWAGCNNYPDIVKRLLECKPHIIPSINMANNLGNTPLSSSSDHAEVVKLLLNEPTIYPNIPNKEGQTPLHTSCRNGRLNVVELLCNHPLIQASLNHTDEKGRTPAHCAAYNQNLNCLEILIKKGVDTTIVDRQGRTVQEAVSHSSVIPTVKQKMNDLIQLYRIRQQAWARRGTLLLFQIAVGYIKFPRADDMEKKNESASTHDDTTVHNTVLRESTNFALPSISPPLPTKCSSSSSLSLLSKPDNLIDKQKQQKQQQQQQEKENKDEEDDENVMMRQRRRRESHILGMEDIDYLELVFSDPKYYRRIHRFL